VSPAAAAIPEKLFFKIGEVCEIAGVQAHVLRYWETEFPMLAPQKNRAGQRTYRRRDVEMALRIKELLYEEQYTIAGAKKKLASELRAPVRDKIVGADSATSSSAPRTGRSLATLPARSEKSSSEKVPSTDQRAALREIAAELREILDLLDNDDAPPKSSRR
jgi:DNA-binding transcriptional MerR regulator